MLHGMGREASGMDRYLLALRLRGGAVLVSLAIMLAFALSGSDRPLASTMLTTLFAGLTVISFLLPAAENPPLSQRRTTKWLLLALATFVLCISISTAFAIYDPSAAWLEGIKLGGVACAFALGLRCSLADEQAKRLFEYLLYAGGIWAVASILMFILDPAGIYGVQKFGAGRLTGAFSSPNSAGTLFGALGVMALGRIISRILNRRDPQILERIDPVMAAVCVASLSALMLTLSRGAIFSTVICAGILVILLLRDRWSLLRLASVGAAATVVLAIVFASPLKRVLGRFDAIDGDALVRLTILKSHFNFAVRQSWFGTGLGSFNTVNDHIVKAQDYQQLSVIRSMHNVYLQWFEETGAMGLAALAFLNLVIWATLISAARRRNQMGGRIWAILMGYLVFLLHGFTDYAFQEPVLALFVSLLLGCGFAMAGNTTAFRGAGE